MEETDKLLEKGEGSEKDDEKKVVSHKLENFRFIDGLRGIAAIGVFFNNVFDEFFHLETEDERDHPDDHGGVNRPPDYFRDTPVKIIYQGTLWVALFFIISGFVLTLRYFQTDKRSAITGGSFRRYFRLMVPLVVVLSIYFLVMKLDLMGEKTYAKLKRKSYGDILYDGLVTTWYGDVSWFYATWTLSTELIATYFIYQLAKTAKQYRGRFFVYALTILFFMVTEVLGATMVVKTKMNRLFLSFPLFFLGLALSDLETMPDGGPLSKVRALHWAWKIPINLLLFAIFLIYGSNSNEENSSCYTAYDEPCELYQWVTLWQAIDARVCQYLGAVSLLVLALTSGWFQWTLDSWPFQFLGRISYSFYLMHSLIVDWCMRDTYNWLTGADGPNQDPNMAILYCVLIYLPVLILVSWAVEFLVDTPAKDFSNELDIQLRRKRPLPPNDEDPEEYYSCFNFSKRIWPIFGMLIWLLLVLVVTVIYSGVKGSGGSGSEDKKLHHALDVQQNLHEFYDQYYE